MCTGTAFPAISFAVSSVMSFSPISWMPVNPMSLRLSTGVISLALKYLLSSSSIHLVFPSAVMLRASPLMSMTTFGKFGLPRLGSCLWQTRMDPWYSFNSATKSSHISAFIKYLSPNLLLISSQLNVSVFIACFDVEGLSNGHTNPFSM